MLQHAQTFELVIFFCLEVTETNRCHFIFDGRQLFWDEHTPAIDWQSAIGIQLESQEPTAAMI